jgi:Rrf2 family transcriptional regulator, cysteine metabolism repressor
MSFPLSHESGYSLGGYTESSILMRLTSRTEYALLALVYLARHTETDYVAVDEIAQAQGIPPKFLEQILLVLKRGTYLVSLKGQRGGYKLAKPPAEVNLAEVIRLLDGPLAPTDSVSKNFYRSTPIEKEEKLTGLFTQIRDCILSILEHTTLADVI